MNSYRGTALLVVFAFGAFGCLRISPAQEVRPNADKPSVSAAKTQTSTEAKPAADKKVSDDGSKGTIYFYRIKQFSGSVLEPTVFCDDKELARMDNGRYFGVKLDSGKHVCRMGDKQTGFEVDVMPGQAYYGKVSLEMGVWKPHGRLTLVQPEQGAFELKNVKLLGTDKVKDRSLVVICEGGDKQ